MTTSGSPSRKPKTRGRLWYLVAVVAVVGAAFGVFAWQQGDDGAGGPLNAIAEAAVKTQEQSGGRAVMHSVITTPSQPEPFTMTGQMVFDADGRTRAVITAPHTPAGGPMRLDAVSDGTVMYMHSNQFGSLPGGARWMSIDFSFGDDLETPVPANVDAKGELALLEAVGNDVQKLGKEDVRGVPTTHYRGTISVSDEIKRAREAGADELASLSEKEGSPLHVEAWIDADGLVRRMRLVNSRPSDKGDGPVTTDMRMDFIDFGIEPEIEVPDSSEVFDATELARGKAGLSNDETG